MKKVIILFFAAALVALQARATAYYVSKSGSDSNSGTSTNSPYLTIQKAAGLMNAGDTCYIFSGVYREIVAPSNSGTSASPITFTAYPGETPIVSGADLLTLSWSVYSNSIYQATTTKSFRQLFADGVMMNEARWPNAVVDDLVHAPRSAPSSCTLTNLVDAALPNLDFTGATLHIFPNEFSNQGYTANTRPITGWDPVAKKISWSANIYNSGAAGTLYYVYGALSLLDIATEWYLDIPNNKLYLWCPDGASPANHVIEIKMRNNAFTLDNRSYVVVSGIYVFGAGISMINTTSCTVDDCSLEYVQHNTTADWTVGVPIANQVSGTGSVWKNSTIKFSSQDAIRCSGLNEVVSNCVIQQVDYYPGTYYACVTAFGPGSGTKIVNNTLAYSGRYCVGSSAHSVEIAYNDLGFGDLLTSDGGAEYVYVGDNDGSGTTIHNNLAHNSWAGVYVDGRQNDYLVYRNVCYSNYIGMLFNAAAGNQIINNTSVSNISKDLLLNGPCTNFTLFNNIWRTTQINHTGLTESNNGWYPPLGTNYMPQEGSGAIDGGIVVPPYTDGYVGAAPDVGAYEVGAANWTAGAGFTPQAFPNPYTGPFINTRPLNQTTYIGESVAFVVTATGAAPLHYQWQAGATGSGVYSNLSVSGQIDAITNTSLSISNLEFANAGDYVVVVTNVNGSTTSAPATLTVLDPAALITEQPADATNFIRQTATFTVTAEGLPPLYYQWRAGAHGDGVYTNLTDGGQFSGTGGALLTISNVFSGNAGDYLVVVSNSYNLVTSSVAALTVMTNPTYRATILGDNPVSFWPLDETGGTVIHDIVGTNNGACVNPNGLTLGAPGILNSQGVPTDKAIYFTNTASAYIKVPYSATLNTPQFTIEAWLNLPTFPAVGASADMNPLSFDDSNPKGWTFEISNPNLSNPNLYGWLGQNNSWTIVNSGKCLQAQWAHYVFTYDGATFAMYTNGVSAGSVASPYTQVSSLHSLYMGAYDSSGSPARYYRGGMANVAYYSHALSATQVMNHYQVGSTAVLGPSIISIQPSGTNVILNWTSGFLQKRDSLTGPWTYVTNAVSPYSVGATNPIQFFRGILQSP
jgi:hypothetical protein